MDLASKLPKKARRNLLPGIQLLVVILILYTTISRLVNWDIFTAFLNYRIPLLLEHIGFSGSGFHLQISTINSWIIRFTILFTVLLLAITQWKYLCNRSFWLVCLPLMALLAFTGLSRYWSVSVGFSDARFQLLLAAALGGILIGIRYKKTALRTILEIFAVLIMIGSLALVLIYPDKFTFFDNRGFVVWIGFSSWKMPFGMVMGFAVVLFLFRLLDLQNEKWLARIYGIVFYGLAWFLLYKSNSDTEVLAVVAVHSVLLFGILYLKWGHHLKPIHWGLLAGLVVALVIGAWFSRGFLLGLIGRASTLSWRLNLWSKLGPIIKNRLFLGFGFGEAFWKNPDYTQLLWDTKRWAVPAFAHNGYVEALLDTGLVGLTLWIVFLFQMATLSLRYFVRQHNLPALFYFSWFVFMAVMNVGNNHLGSYETFTMLLLVISFTFVVRDGIDRTIGADPGLAAAITDNNKRG